MATKILQKDNPILRQISKSILEKEIKSPKIKKIILDMKKALNSQEDGIAISAIQIAEPVRIFLISKKIFEILGENKDEIREKVKDLIFINPKIKKFSKEKQLLEEGCLSVRYLYGKVSRCKKVQVEATDENGNKFSRGFSGLLAQIIQHENDHLDGILFIDKAIDIEEIKPENIK
ncbi:MAG: peptide deformylase [Candidatus Paceibacterota bacterium]|jgi:peptide deformylase